MEEEGKDSLKLAEDDESLEFFVALRAAIRTIHTVNASMLLA
jgi:hypothetical protein